MSTPLDDDPTLMLDLSRGTRGVSSPVDAFDTYAQFFESRVHDLTAEEYRHADFASMLRESGLTKVTGEQAKNALAEIDLLDDGTYLGSTNKPAPNGQPTSRGNDLPDH